MAEVSTEMLLELARNIDAMVTVMARDIRGINLRVKLMNRSLIKRVPMQIELDTEVLEKVRERAVHMGVSLSEYIEYVLLEFLDDHAGLGGGPEDAEVVGDVDDLGGEKR